MSDLLVVTGPSGNIGGELTRKLVALGPDAPPYRLAAHTPSRITDEYGPDVPVAHLDYNDPSTFASALEGVTTLFLLFPLPSPRTARTRMRPMVDAAVTAGANHIIYISVPGADRSRVVPHNTVERYIHAAGLGSTILRPSYFMQNMVRALSTHGVDISEHDEVFVPAKRGKTTFLDSRDLAEVIVKIARDPAAHNQRSYLLPGPETLDFYEVAGILTDVLGREITYANPSMVKFWRRLRRRGVSRDTVFFMQLVYTLARRGFNAPPGDDMAELLDGDPTTFRKFAEDYKWRWDTQTWT